MITRRPAWTALAFASCVLASPGAGAGDFSVSPIRAELGPSAPSETITVTNHSPGRLRVSIKLMAWTQDAEGKDVYTDSSDLIYFPRQMDIDKESRKIVRIGAKSPPHRVERAYRLFIEEMPDPLDLPGRPSVNFVFRFGVPIFVPPPDGKPSLDVQAPTLAKGKVVLPVRNDSNAHVRLTKINVSDGAGLSIDANGWYSLAGTQRTYTVDIPPEACRKSKSLLVTAEGPAAKFERRLDVDPANCS
jgi:fimbrial chaperone protein